MKIIKVKNLKIGEGRPKIIVPIVERSKDKIIEKAISLKNNLKIDTVEWRADFYDDVFNRGELSVMLKKLREIIPDTPILFTFRTKKEGGEKGISMNEYIELNKLAADSKNVDFIDVEIFNEAAGENIKNIHDAGVLSVGSYHDFFKTPSKMDIMKIFCKMQDMGADILKVAVMPENTEDVLTLLSAENEMYTKYADRPIIAISMSSLGIISRLSGEAFGSSMTFGSLFRISAPGQIPVEQLYDSLNMLHSSLCFSKKKN